jgi:SIR2-like protein
MTCALLRREKDARRELCRWNDLIKDEPSVFDGNYIPSAANPLVFHLHGHSKLPESIVLTEDDYLDFLERVGREGLLLPERIRSVIKRSTCVFIGYRLADWNFRVLFRGLRAYSIAGSIAILKPPGDDELARRQRAYLDRYYANINLKVYWGTAREFTIELHERWKEFDKVRWETMQQTTA